MINQKWIFGNRAGLDFSTPIPTPYPASANLQINTGEGCASISDATGQLLFYTDGSKLWDAPPSNIARASGTADGLDGNPSSTQSAIIVPDPGNSQRYYVFTADGASGNNMHVNGLRIDLSNNWSKMPLANLMTMPINTNRSATERITAIQHANCTDFWVLTVVQQTNVAGSPGIFRLFLVNSLGVQYLGETPMGVNVSDLGYLKGSPNGRRLGLADYSNNLVRVYDFNNALGVINLGTVVTINVPASALNPAVPNHPRQPYGIEFSPNNNVLYFSLLGAGASTGTNPVNNGYVFQVDLTASTPTPLQVVLYPNPASSAGYAVGALQLGMDGRIYIAKHNESTVGAILSPNTLGVGTAGCNPNMSFITLPTGSSCNLGLPNLIPNKCPCACEAGPCEADVNTANQVLDTRAGLKQFTIPAKGQTVPTTCDLAFENLNFGPVFTLKWGDGPSDQFESEDFEVIYILAHNPYRNLIYRNLMIFDITITPNQTLPNGDDAVMIIPAEIACFEEVQPCSHVARDFALVLDHCLVGTYHIAFKYCIEEIAIVSGTNGNAIFDINVVAS